MEAAGMAPVHSAPTHPQILPGEESARVACRRGQCLHPQIQPNEDRTEMLRLRSGTSPASPASLPDDNDMLREILLRLPPRPSTLPRAAAVCKRWRGLVTDPKFLRSFRAHHRKPPLLGFFQKRDWRGEDFTPTLDPPDRIPPARFSLGRCSSNPGYDLLDCRHGLVLVKSALPTVVVVCDPVTSEQRRLAVPPEFRICFFNGAVLCAAGGDQDHVHGACHSGPFKVVLMSMYKDINRPTVCVYSSETGIWGNLISTEPQHQLGGDVGNSATLLGNALYWLSRKDRIVEFDSDGQSLAVITGPVTNDVVCQNHRIIRAEDGALGFAVLSFPCFQMWRRNVNGHGVATWMPWKTVEMHTLLGLPSQIDKGWKLLMGYAEDNDVVFFIVGYSVYMVQLTSMQSRKLYETKYTAQCHPFMSFYAPGTTINGGSNGAEMMHDT